MNDLKKKHAEEKGASRMTREEAQKYIEQLTYEEKKKLNDLLTALAQRRQPSAAPQASKK